MMIAPGIIQCEKCGDVYPHDQGYHHWLDFHAPKEKTVTLKTIRAQENQERR